MDYKDAGVDVEAGYKAVELMKKHISRTKRKEVLSDIGGFGGMFSLGQHAMKEPVLLSGTDGVGTKLKVAFLCDKHDTVGIDLVAMCVNDILCAGATPLFFLDYIACGKNTPEQIEQIVKGIADGCVMANAALIGGETAEMPGFYSVNEYDLAGFTVGIVDKENIIDGSRLQEGDVLLALPSSGIHSNGYSLVRKIIMPTKEKLHKVVEEMNMTLGEALLEPTKIYVKEIEALKEKIDIKAISHITGGGFYENIPRMLKEGTKAIIHKGTWEKPAIFSYLQKEGKITEEEMYHTFNMGVGMLLSIPKNQASEAIEILEKMEETGYIIGEIVEGERGIEIC